VDSNGIRVQNQIRNGDRYIDRRGVETQRLRKAEVLDPSEGCHGAAGAAAAHVRQAREATASPASPE